MEVYKSSDGRYFMRIDEERFISANVIKIDPYYSGNLENFASENRISNAVLADIKTLLRGLSNGSIRSIEELNVYVPISPSSLGAEQSSTKTYTGYAGRQYYEELLTYNSTSESFSVKKPNYGFGTYASNVLKAAAVTAGTAVMDYITGGAWTIASIFAQSPGYSSIPTTAASTHSAVLHENKYRKYT